jgi:hypothetical protein
MAGFWQIYFALAKEKSKFGVSLAGGRAWDAFNKRVA